MKKIKHCRQHGQVLEMNCVTNVGNKVLKGRNCFKAASSNLKNSFLPPTFDLGTMSEKCSKCLASHNGKLSHLPASSKENSEIRPKKVKTFVSSLDSLTHQTLSLLWELKLKQFLEEFTVTKFLVKYIIVHQKIFHLIFVLTAVMSINVLCRTLHL